MNSTITVNIFNQRYFPREKPVLVSANIRLDSKEQLQHQAIGQFIY